MIDYACFCQIKHLHAQQGLSAAQIAATLALDPRTVAYWLTQERFRPRKATQRASKLDPFKPDIVRWLERHPYSAAQVFQRLREDGFAGSYELVKAYVHTVRPRRQAAFLTLAFAPGECAQVDWGSVGSVPVGQTYRRRSFHSNLSSFRLEPVMLISFSYGAHLIDLSKAGRKKLCFWMLLILGLSWREMERFRPH